TWLANRREASAAEPATAEGAEDQAAVGATLRDDRDAAAQARQIPEVGAVEPRGLGVDAHAVGPDQAQPGATRQRQQHGLALASLGIDLAESGREDDRGAH